MTLSHIQWVDALHSNPYDGHTLKETLESAESSSGRTIKQVFVDRGYKGAAKDVPEKDVFMSGARGLSKPLRKWLRRRQAVEPVIGHMKSGHRMDRNHLQGWEGDRMNAVLSGCGFNLMKLYRVAAFYIRFILAGLTAIIAGNGPKMIQETSDAA